MVSMPQILLRPWCRADAPALLSMYAAAPDLSRQFAEPIRTVADAEGVIVQRFAVTPEQTSAVIEVEGRLVGQIGLSDIRFSGPRAGTAWVSYFTHPEARGRGVTQRSCAALSTWAFVELGLARLELGYRVDNPASAAVAKGAGFVVEGLERAKLVHDGVRHDIETAARLATDPTPASTGVRIETTLRPTGLGCG